MNLTDLKYIIEIDKRGSISQTAKEIYIAQPNLSKAIKNVETEFGIQIFIAIHDFILSLQTYLIYCEI